ncbi:hypothetical protein [Mesorhizobium metallidurans]|uniref:hypothetical protein n=1 Tax=Mesorhizobium metallidurans TaxID=489722 RepID=UPI00058AFBE7|nr:hypothetical protein [Mesorhizobium metallidurans]
MTEGIDGDSNDQFIFDPDVMKVFSRDGSVNVLAKQAFGGKESEYMAYGYAIEWSGGVSCFWAQIDYVRDEAGSVVTIDKAGRAYGIVWRDVRLHGFVQDLMTRQAFRSEVITDDRAYQAFGRLVASFLCVNRVLRHNPPVRFISFHRSEHFEPREIKVA